MPNENNSSTARSDCLPPASEIEEQERVIAMLCAAAPDAIRDCLRKYVPRKAVWQIEAALKQSRKQLLVDTLKYLGVPDMDEFQAAALPHELVCRIQNLFPDVCHICNQKYCVKLGDKPIVSCALCGQGSHNECLLQILNVAEGELNQGNQYGLDMLNPYATVGLIYLCGVCQKTALPQKDSLKIKAKTNTRPKAADTQQTQNPELDPINLASTHAVQSQDLIPDAALSAGSPVDRNEDRGSTTDGAAATPTHNRNDEQRNLDGNSSAEIRIGGQAQNQLLVGSRARLQQLPQSGSSAQNSTDSVCRFYKEWRCKHGMSGRKDGGCKYAHPKPCKQFMTNGNRRQRGCTKGNQCDSYHPKVCNESLKKRLCTNNDCKYPHIQGTLRSAPATNGEAAPPRNPRQQTRGHVAQPKTSAGNSNTQQTANSSDVMAPFLEQLKQMNEQMQLFHSKLQQMDQRWNSLQQPALHPMFRPNLPFQPYHSLLGPQGHQSLVLPPQTA